MRELERDLPPHTPPAPRDPPPSVGVVGDGRLGTVIARTLRDAGWAVDGPVGRGVVPRGDILLLCVPDGEISTAAAVVAGAAARVGHTSGATPLSALAPAAAAGAETFGLHPLQTVAWPDARLEGAGCAIAGSSPGAARAARELALALGMRPFLLADEDRAAYHAAASIASNFVVTLESAAERVAASAGLPPEQARGLLAPLVRGTVENWAALEPERALTGPVARGDRTTVALQRAAVAEAAPELVPLWDVLVERTTALAGRGRAADPAAATA